MKILFLTPYFYNCEVEMKKQSTGFGIYVVKLAEELAKLPNMKVYIISLKNRVKKDMQVNGVNYLGMSVSSMLKKGLQKKDMLVIRQLVKLNYYNQNIVKKTIHATYVQYKAKYIKDALHKLDPDILHVHSLAPETYSIFREIDGDNKRNLIVTLHALLDKEKDKSDFGLYEWDMLHKLIDRNIAITVVGSRMQDKIKRRYNVNEKNIFTILNGTSELINDKCKIDIYKKYGIKDGFKILLCVGTLCKNKNQVQVIRALDIVIKKYNKKVCLLLVGKDNSKGELEYLISHLGITQNIRICGFVEHQQMDCYYKAAWGVITASNSEAFGLPIIEGFKNGVPALAYEDLDAIPDLYNENAMIVVRRCSDESLARGILQLLEKEWSKVEIINHAQHFYMSNIIKEYNLLYQKIKGEKQNEL